MLKPALYLIAILLVIIAIRKSEVRKPVQDSIVPRPIVQVPEPKLPQPLVLTPLPINRYLSLEEINSLMSNWSKEAKDITELGVVGQTTNNRPIPYLKIGKTGPKILIHAAIHGNERIATSCTLYVMHKLLSDYAKDTNATWTIENRQVYFVPVLSTDSYVSNQRYCEGVDPNRSYPCPEDPNHKSVAPVVAIQRFHQTHKFSGVISGHSFGRVYLYPRFGSDQAVHRNLAEEMGSISGYHTHNVGGSYSSRSPGSRGYDVDWYYWSGAVSLLTEFGAGSHNMNPKLLEAEAERNYGAYVLFIKKAPDIKLIGFKTSNRYRRYHQSRQTEVLRYEF